MGKSPLSTLLVVALAAVAAVFTGGLALLLYALPGILHLPKENRTAVDSVTAIDGGPEGPGRSGHMGSRYRDRSVR